MGEPTKINMNALCKYNLCRLCLCRGDCLLDIFDDGGKRDFTIADAIQDLLQFQVVKAAGIPWLACNSCVDKLSEFRLFKERSIECKVAFEARFEATKEMVLVERQSTYEELMQEIKSEEIEDESDEYILGDGKEDVAFRTLLHHGPVKEEIDDTDVRSWTRDSLDGNVNSPGKKPSTRMNEDPLQVGEDDDLSEAVIEISDEADSDWEQDGASETPTRDGQREKTESSEHYVDTATIQRVHSVSRDTDVDTSEDGSTMGQGVQKVFVLEGSVTQDMKRRNKITLERKLQMVLKHEWGQSASSIAREMGYPVSTVSTILKDGPRVKSHIGDSSALEKVSLTRRHPSAEKEVEKMLQDMREKGPMSTRPKRNKIDLERKLEMIRKYEQGQNLSSIAREYGYPVSTTNSIIKDGERFKEVLQRALLTKQRFRVAQEMKKVLQVRAKETRLKPTKRNKIDLERKLEMIRKYEQGQNLSSIAREFGYPVSTTNSIIKDGERFKSYAVPGQLRLYRIHSVPGMPPPQSQPVANSRQLRGQIVSGTEPSRVQPISSGTGSLQRQLTSGTSMAHGQPAPFPSLMLDGSPESSELLTGAVYEMEKRLLLWIEAQIAHGATVNLTTIQTKAKQIFEEVKGKHGDSNEKFVASNEWFLKFKRRAGFRV